MENPSVQKEGSESGRKGTREPENNGSSKSLPINNNPNVNDGILQSKICSYWMNFLKNK